MTDKEKYEINQYIKPGAIVPVDMQTTALLIDALRTALTQAESEHDLEDVRCEGCGYMTFHREHMGCIRTALAQPKKEWVGLTDEEYELMAEKRVTNYFFNTLDYAHDIEAKLKEKNT